MQRPGMEACSRAKNCRFWWNHERAAAVPSENQVMTGFERLKGDRLRLELSSAVVLRLLENRQLCAAELHCLDCETKKCLRSLLLTSCARTLKPQLWCKR